LDDSKFIYTIKIKKRSGRTIVFFHRVVLVPASCTRPKSLLAVPNAIFFQSSSAGSRLMPSPELFAYPPSSHHLLSRSFPSPPRLPVHLVLPLPSPLQGRPPARGHALGVVSLAAHPTGARAAEVSVDSFAHVFDVDSGGLATLEAAPSKVWAVQFHPKVSTEHGWPTPVVRNRDFSRQKKWLLSCDFYCNNVRWFDGE